LFGDASPLGVGARFVHAVAGFVFAVAVIASVFLGASEARPVAWDCEWLRRYGGYLGFQGTLPAGKLNAGQKIYFWFIATTGIVLFLTGILMYWHEILPGWHSLIYTLHDLLAIFVLCGVILHFYLSVVVNPGSLGGMVDGSVSVSWARKHHPLWSQEAREREKF
jgi:formate dehydrogenase subunit gamma